MRASLVAFALFSACKSDKGEVGDVQVGTPAIVDPARPESFFDTPWPSDALRTSDGLPDLVGYPAFGTDIAAPIVAGWATRLGMMAQGFGNNTAAYFRFEGLISVPEETEGLPTDPALLIDMATGELIPLATRFIVDPQGDPYYAPYTLAMAPALGHPPRSGATLAAVVMGSAGAASPEGYHLPDGVQDALALAHVSGAAAVATVYTVQDATDQLQQLVRDVDARIDDRGGFGDVTFTRVIRLEFTVGTTPSGEDSTLCTATFEDGRTEVTYLGPIEPDLGTHTVELDDTWPMVVYQAEIPVFNYSGLDDQPYMKPGFQHVSDYARYSGWIAFEGGQLTAEPDPDTMRITVSLPRGEDGEPLDGAPVVLWDHGTAGHAYEPIQRRSRLDQGRAVAEVYAEEGYAVIGRDAALYGRRYPLIDEGYGDSLGFYNIVNLPAFRDNQRETAIEGHQLLRFVVDGELNSHLPAGAVDINRLRRAGHSMGSVTANLGLSAEPERYEAAFLSGTGGVFAHYFLDTGLLGDIDPAVIAALFALFGAEEPEEVTTQAALGAALGLPEAAWGNIDRLHPVITLFQWTMDPSDPMAVARDELLPARILKGVGDHQVPNFTTDALSLALPDVTVEDCVPTATDYDPHSCLWREVEGQQILADWLAGP